MDRSGIWEKMARVVDLSTEPVPGKSLVEIVGDSAVLIENHCGILSFDTEKIVVKTKTGCLCITGSCMHVSKMTKEQMRICGRIFGVEIRGRR